MKKTFRKGDVSGEILITLNAVDMLDQPGPSIYGHMVEGWVAGRKVFTHSHLSDYTLTEMLEIYEHDLMREIDIEVHGKCSETDLEKTLRGRAYVGDGEDSCATVAIYDEPDMWDPNTSARIHMGPAGNATGPEPEFQHVYERRERVRPVEDKWNPETASSGDYPIKSGYARIGISGYVNPPVPVRPVEDSPSRSTRSPAGRWTTRSAGSCSVGRGTTTRAGW